MEVIRETALLGTEKKALDIQHLPEPVKQMLDSIPTSDAEMQFLEANSFYHFYDLAGRMPAKFAGTIDDTIIEEELQVAPAFLMEVYSKFELVDHQLIESALSSWLDVLISNRFIVSSDRLVELIHDGKNASNNTKEKIVSVIGRKGLWILENDTTLSYAVAPKGDHLWTEGTIQERKHMFTAQRKSDPQGALEMLKSTWNTESVVNKKSFLELIKETSAPSDISFLEELAVEFKHHAKEKKTEKECRRIVVSILLRHPAASLYKTTTDQLDRYMVKAKKGIVGFVTGQASGSFRLPDVEDNFWNAQVMNEVYGFEVKTYDIAVYSNVQQFWLSYFIEYLPFAYWLNAFEADHKKAVQFWLLDKTTISGRSVSLFLQGMVNNAQDYGDSELALAILQTQEVESVMPLLKVLSPKDFETFVARKDHLDDVPVLMNGPFDNDQTWSLSFSESILQRAYTLCERNQTPTALGKVIAQFAHHNSIDALYQLNNKARDTNAYHTWNTSIFQLVHPMLDIRNKIHALKK